jgi:hypothetical protein
VFLIVADHDNRVYGDSLVPIKKFHIPGLILGADVQPAHYHHRQPGRPRADAAVAAGRIERASDDWPRPCARQRHAGPRADPVR